MVSLCGTRMGTVWNLSRALDPAKENIHALESLNRYIVWVYSVGLLRAKTEIPVYMLMRSGVNRGRVLWQRRLL